MDGSIEPDVYVMTWAWYGVVPTGAQFISWIVLKLSPRCYAKDIYVDDVNPGAETEAEQEKQIFSTQSVLQHGGLASNTEFIVQ